MMTRVTWAVGVAALMLLGGTEANAAAQAVRHVAPSQQNVVYVPGGTPDQTLDLYVPDRTGFATVVFIHGGSLRDSGERRTSPVYARACEPFFVRGIACATVDYRLAPDHRWPAMPNDAAAAFAWVRSTIESLGGDPSRVFLFGHSSGCHLAATLGANPKYLERVGLSPVDVAGVVAMGCILAPLREPLRRAAEAGGGLDELRKRWETLSSDTVRFETFEDKLDSDPSRFVGPLTPPTLIVIARAERFRPTILEEAAHFVDLMYDDLRPADIVIVPGTHYSSIQALGEPGNPTLAAILEFMDDPGAAGTGSRPAKMDRGSGRREPATG
jgi:acetyl esterase/lipase